MNALNSQQQRAERPMGRRRQFVIALASAALAVAAGITLAPEACGLGLTFGVVLLVLQVEGNTVLRIGAALFRRDAGRLEIGVRTRLLSYFAIAGLCVAAAAASSMSDVAARGASFIVVALPFTLLVFASPTAFGAPD